MCSPDLTFFGLRESVSKDLVCDFIWPSRVLRVMSTSSTEGSGSLSPSPVAPNAPKFGTLIPNRIFVGGIAPNTTESELHSVFATYGNVKATKIILDRAGVSKGYGFVTFETEEEARRIQREADVILKDRKLNIAPAIKKQPFARVYDSPPAVPNTGTILYPNSLPLRYPTNGVTFFTPPENVCTYGNPQTNFNVIYPSSVYLPQQTFQFHPMGAAPYPAGAPVPEMAQFVPAAPPHYFIPEHNY